MKNNKIEVDLLPLEGKYYGTKVCVDGTHVKFWLSFSGHDKSFIPSDRELEKKGITRTQWDNNELITYTDCFGEPDTDYAKEIVAAVDHFEDQLSYEAALLFVKQMKETFQ